MLRRQSCENNGTGKNQDIAVKCSRHLTDGIYPFFLSENLEKRAIDSLPLFFIVSLLCSFRYSSRFVSEP